MTWFKSLSLAGRELLPIVQGGMGVGVSAHRLAGAVASQNAVGTIASVDLRHHHADLVEKTDKCNDRDTIDIANREALHREVRAALETARGRGLVAVNVMKAVRDHPALVRRACESGAQAIVMGAGLPLDLPDMTADFPKVALVPILSEARGVAAVLKKWMKKGRLADAVVIEHPGYAGGHLGAGRLGDIHNERFDFKRVLADCHALFGELQLGRDAPRLIVAGGVGSHEQVRHWLANGADGVQVGTAFAVTHEGDAHENFKRVLIDANPDELAEFTSVAGLPARAVPTPWLTRYLRQEGTLQANTRSDPRRCSQRMDCLTQCGLRDGIAKFGQFCIDLKLAAAMRGEVSRGLFFRGASKLPFGDAMRSVRELMDYLLHGQMPAAA